MRVAYITSHPDMRGGGERFVYETASRLQKLGYEVTIFCNSMNPDKAYSEMLKIPYEVFAARRNFFGYFHAYFGLKAIRKLMEEATKWEPDIIFPQMGYVFADYFQRLTDIHIVPYVHYPETFQPHKKNWVRTLYRKTLRIKHLETLSFENVPLVLCNSYNTEQMIRQLAPNANIRVIYPGVDHNKFNPTWKDEGYVYYHSRYQPSKNQLLAVEAVGGKYPLVLSGFLTEYNREYYSEVEEKTARHGHKILTNISDPEMLSLFQNCSIFLFPSRGEHFGIAPVEAMACGKPVIGHDSGGTRETVGKAGILCGDDVQEWRSEICRLMENREIRLKYAKSCYEFSKGFSWENTVNEMVEAFNFVSRQPSGSRCRETDPRER